MKTYKLTITDDESKLLESCLKNNITSAAITMIKIARERGDFKIETFK